MQGRHKRRPANAHTNYTLYTDYTPYKYYKNCIKTEQFNVENNIYVNFTQESMTQTKLTPVRQTLFSYLIPPTYHTCLYHHHTYINQILSSSHMQQGNLRIAPVKSKHGSTVNLKLLLLHHSKHCTDAPWLYLDISHTILKLQDK